MTRETEMQIIKRVLDGHIDEFEALVHENQKKIYNLALKMVGNREDAWDISQETFIKAFKALKSFRETAVLAYGFTDLQQISVETFAQGKSENLSPCLHK